MKVNKGIKKMDKREGILIVSVTIFVLSLVGTASATNWSVDGSGGADFSGIQEAINKASVGDTIIVHSGVYYENVVVNKSVTLKGIGYPVVDAGGEENAIMLCADGITLVGFIVTNSGSLWNNAAGIKVTSNSNNISCNNASNNWEGIVLRESSNNTITGNDAGNNYMYGICLDHSSNNTITGNNVNNNNWYGICIDFSSNINTISGNTVSNNNEGIIIWNSSSNTIKGNTVSNNDRSGIYLHWAASSNIITGNTVSNNNWNGIRIWFSNNNKIYLNNIVGNDDNVYSLDANNIWHSPQEIAYSYDGNAYRNYLGNYWADYAGRADADGIGNTPYSIDSKSDESDDYPLMQPFENYNIPTSAHS